MREDMHHVIIDRPRTGGDGGKSIAPKGSKRRRQRTPLEDHLRTESMAPGRLYGWDCKELNEHLSPLRRWLRSNCGRRWDDVYSELCEGLSVRNATTAHVRDHAERYVLKNTRLINGEVCDSKDVPIKHGEVIRRIFQRWHAFYVHPIDGTLREAPPPRWHRREAIKKNYVQGKDDMHQYHLIDGIWYEVELAFFLPADIYGKTDVVLGFLNHYQAQKMYGRFVYAKSKRQVGKEQIRKAKLWESPLGREARQSAGRRKGSG